MDDRIYAEINLTNLEKNVETLHKEIRPDCRMCAVIKADAYGHGAGMAAQTLEKLPYIWGFAVASGEEALELWRHGVSKPILILGYVFPEEWEALIRAEVRMTVFDEETAEAIDSCARSMGRKAFIHIAVDTGMSRIGFADEESSVAPISRIVRMENLVAEGLFTHFARADEESRKPFDQQFGRFKAFEKALSAAGITFPIVHISNSASQIRFPEANYDMVRAGISMYGIYPSEPDIYEGLKLLPVMTLKSHVTYVKPLKAGSAVSYGGTFEAERDMVVATVPVGYADGWPRSLSGRGAVLIHGQRARILGRICMDQFMVDVTDIPDVRRGDEVVLMGRQGEGEMPIEELSEISGRFPYEFVCCISKRVPRIPVREGAD